MFEKIIEKMIYRINLTGPDDINEIVVNSLTSNNPSYIEVGIKFLNLLFTKLGDKNVDKFFSLFKEILLSEVMVNNIVKNDENLFILLYTHVYKKKPVLFSMKPDFKRTSNPLLYTHANNEYKKIIDKVINPVNLDITEFNYNDVKLTADKYDPNIFILIKNREKHQLPSFRPFNSDIIIDYKPDKDGNAVWGAWMKTEDSSVPFRIKFNDEYLKKEEAKMGTGVTHPYLKLIEDKNVDGIRNLSKEKFIDLVEMCYSKVLENEYYPIFEELMDDTLFTKLFNKLLILLIPVNNKTGEKYSLVFERAKKLGLDSLLPKLEPANFEGLTQFFTKWSEQNKEFLADCKLSNIISEAFDKAFPNYQFHTGRTKLVNELVAKLKGLENKNLADSFIQDSFNEIMKSAEVKFNDLKEIEHKRIYNGIIETTSRLDNLRLEYLSKFLTDEKYVDSLHAFNVNLLIKVVSEVRQSIPDFETNEKYLYARTKYNDLILKTEKDFSSTNKSDVIEVNFDEDPATTSAFSKLFKKWSQLAFGSDEEIPKTEIITTILPGILSDSDIIALCENTDTPMLSPFNNKQIRVDAEGKKIISKGVTSFGYDATLANKFKIFTNINSVIIDPLNFSEQTLSPHEGDYVIIPPNGYALGYTEETFHMPDDVVSLCVGKSTYARTGLIINVTPIEPGFVGQVVIEMANNTTLPIKVYANMGIAQFLFFKGNKRATVTYADRGGKYQNQTGITLAKV